jgi:1L-myo-inositol 1-phosphate cytidylyltransferase
LNAPLQAGATVVSRVQQVTRSGERAAPTAVILAAGAGSRLRGTDETAPPKPLTPVLGKSLIERTIRTFRSVGVRDVVVIVGHEREHLAWALPAIAQATGVRVTPVENHRWELGNSTSVLAAAEHVSDRFFLAMSDHLFTSGFLSRLLDADEGLPLSLVVDYNWASIPDLDEATKVRLWDNRIADIGKDLRIFDAVDTGVFLCRPRLFSAVRRAQFAGDYSLSGAVRVLAGEGGAMTVPSGNLFWQDVDTPEDLALAERRILSHRMSRARIERTHGAPLTLPSASPF